MTRAHPLALRSDAKGDGLALVLRSDAKGGASRRTLRRARPAALTGASFEPPDCDPGVAMTIAVRPKCDLL